MVWFVFWVAPGSCCWAQGSLLVHLVATLDGMSDADGVIDGRGRDSRGASAARRLAAEIVPKWSGASAANTMEYEAALRAIMVEGHGPVEGLLAAVYFGDVDETKEGYLKYQLLRLGAGSDEEGPLERQTWSEGVCVGAGRAAQAGPDSLSLWGGLAGWHFLSDGVICVLGCARSCCWAQGSLPR